MVDLNKRHDGDWEYRQRGIFASGAMQRVLALATRTARSSLPVLITGESGTGKEVLARIIHDRSGRPRARFVPYNCTGTTRDMVDSQLFGHRRGSFTGASEHAPGVIRSADGGTLLLDEIGELDAHIQPKLLRFLENREIQPVGHSRPLQVDVRILAATNADIDRMVREKRFREDLFYRLNIIRIHLPPLRDRREDIPPLVEHFLRRFADEQRKPGIRASSEAIDELSARDWPGNVRQLANEIKRLVTLAANRTTITPEHLAQTAESFGETPVATGAKASALPNTITISTDQPLPDAIEEVERALIIRALSDTKGHLATAAIRLGVSRRGLQLKRRRLNIDEYLARD
jgi:DNA-binding NtrC family response regulator